MKKILCLLLVSMVYLQTFAIPADPNPVTITQPNGEELTLIMKGDEFIHWAVTLDGYTLLVNSDSYFCYAQMNESGDIEPSAYIATEISNRTPEVNAWLQNIYKNLSYSKKQASSYLQLRQIMEEEHAKKKERGQTTGEFKLLVILAEFPDRSFTRTVEDFDMLCNQLTYKLSGNTGSVRDFYLENSYNQLDFKCTVVGPFVTPNNASYYSPENRWVLFARHCIQLAYNAGINFDDYTTTGKTIPGVYIVYAGYDASAGGTQCIWAHAQLSFDWTFNGFLIERYACSSELRGTSGNNLAYIGTICHESGHMLGALDFYDTDYATGGQYDGTGDWDLQSSGSHNNNGKTPPHSNPRSKIYTYGWANAIVLDAPQTVTVPYSKIYKNAFFRINIPHTDANCTEQYYLIENKTKAGFDAYIPGQNLLIYRCTEDYDNRTPSYQYKQNTTSWQRFYPVSANATVAVPTAGTTSQSTYGNVSSSSTTWPGTGNKKEFNNTTTPAMVSWGGTPVNKPISNITVHDDYITFDFIGGGTKSNFHIFLPAYYGVKVNAEPGSISPVNKGGNFSFKVEKLVSHSNSNLKVTANHVELTPSGGVYTITNVQADQIVRIEGVAFNTVTITATADKNGKITPDGDVDINYGGMQTFEIKANNGFSIDKVFVDGVDKGNITSYTFKNVLESHTISATFKAGDTYPINTSLSEMAFETYAGTPTEHTVVTVSQGTPALIANILAEVHAPFQISLNGNQWYAGFNITRAQLPAPLYVRFNPAYGQVGTFKDTLTLKSTDAYNYVLLTGNALLGIDEMDYQDVVIYPNPTTGKLNISSEQTINNVEVFDIFGRLVSPHFSVSTHQIDISNLNAGIYFVVISTEKGKIYKKIIKE